MTPTKIETIQDKLFRLNEHIKFIEDIMKNTDEKIIKDPTLYFALEHMLQLSIQIILDIGAHILAEEFHENPKSYEEVVTLLGEKGVIDKDFCNKQGGMAGFRNKLIHDYDSINKEKTLIYGRLATEVFRTFGKAYVAFIEKDSPKPLTS